MYYVVKTENNEILDEFREQPNFQEQANRFNCSVYIIKGEILGSDIQPKPIQYTEEEIAPAIDEEYSAEDWLRQGRKIQAIKTIKQQQNCGLREAKDIADELEWELKHGNLV